MVERLVLVNATLVIFNMIPAFPMDGGRVLRALLAMGMGSTAATRLAARIGQGFAFLFVLFGLFYNPVLMLVGVFIYFAAAAEEQSASFSGLAKHLKVSDAMEPASATFASSAPLARAIDTLLTTSQRDFPVTDETGRIIGMLDREAMLSALHRFGADQEIGRAMRATTPLAETMELAEAFQRMRSHGSRAEAVSDLNGHPRGVLTLENIGEMMMVASADPAWRFARRTGPWR
jgi:CBS domain-containing protein